MVYSFEVSASNPVSNTGSNKGRFELRIDWVTASATLPSLEAVKECMADIAYLFNEDGGLVIQEGRGFLVGIYYNNSAYTPAGSKFGWRHDEVSNTYRVLTSIPANVLSRVHQEILLSNLRRMSKVWGFKPSRLDIAVDDYGKRLIPANIHAAIQNYDVTGCRRNNMQTIWNSDGGWTFSFGSRQSNKYVRIYNKSVESKGLIDSYRIEAEYHDASAKVIWDFIVGHDNKAAVDFLREVALGAIDFRKQVPGESAIERRPRLDWWQEFLDAANAFGGFRISVPRPRPALAKKMAWLKRQVATSLALIREVFKRTPGKFADYLDELFREGESRLGDVEQAIIRLHELGYESEDDAIMYVIMN